MTLTPHPSYLLTLLALLIGCQTQDVAPSRPPPAVPTPAPDPNATPGPSGLNQVTVGNSTAAEKRRQITRRLVLAQGEVEVNHRAADRDTPVGPDAVVSTGRASRAILSLGVGLLLELQPQTSVQLSRSPRKQISVNILFGGLLSSVPPGASYEVTTRDVLVGSEGGGHLFVSEPSSEQSYVCICDGTMQLTTADATYDHLQEVPQTAHRSFRVATHQGHQSVIPAALHSHTTAQLTELDNSVPLGMPEAGKGKPSP